MIFGVYIVVSASLILYSLLLLTCMFRILLFKRENPDLKTHVPGKKISILIPFRNEEKNLERCLQGISEQDFPQSLVEIILLDDHSEDKSRDVANQFLNTRDIPYTILDLHQKNIFGKKNAIEWGVIQASGEIIITRDADSYTPSKDWLKNVSLHFETGSSDLLLAPVLLSGTSFLASFQRFENMAISLLGFAMTTFKLPFVCSGANLMYKKEAFLTTNPYATNKTIASGDDMFLLQAFLAKGKSITGSRYLPLSVYCSAENTLSAFIQQRLRWASKTAQVKIKTAWFIGIILFLTNLACLIMLLFGIFSSINREFCLFTIIYKCIIDFLLLFLGAIMYKQRLNFIFYPLAFLINLVYTPVLSIISIFVKPSWKGRISL